MPRTMGEADKPQAIPFPLTGSFIQVEGGKPAKNVGQKQIIRCMT